MVQKILIATDPLDILNIEIHKIKTMRTQSTKTLEVDYKI